MAIRTKTDAVKHIELLKIYLDECPDAASIAKRMDSIEARLVIKDGDEGCATRPSTLTEVSFLIKNKKRILEAVGDDRFFTVFNKAIEFLEKNPDKSKKKLKKKLKKGPQASDGANTGITTTGDIELNTALDQFMADFDGIFRGRRGLFADTTAELPAGNMPAPDVQAPVATIEGTITLPDDGRIGMDAIRRLARALEAGQYTIQTPGDRVDGTTVNTHEDRREE